MFKGKVQERWIRRKKIWRSSTFFLFEFQCSCGLQNQSWGSGSDCGATWTSRQHFNRIQSWSDGSVEQSNSWCSTGEFLFNSVCLFIQATSNRWHIHLLLTKCLHVYIKCNINCKLSHLHARFQTISNTFTQTSQVLNFFHRGY